MSLKDEDEMLAKQREELKKHSADKEDSKPVPIAKDSGFIRKKTNLNPAPQVGGGNSGQHRTNYNIECIFLQKDDIMLHFTLSGSSDITGCQCLLSYLLFCLLGKCCGI